jgi:hypothetical protein
MNTVHAAALAACALGISFCISAQAAADTDGNLLTSVATPETGRNHPGPNFACPPGIADALARPANDALAMSPKKTVMRSKRRSMTKPGRPTAVQSKPLGLFCASLYLAHRPNRWTQLLCPPTHRGLSALLP